MVASCLFNIEREIIMKNDYLNVGGKRLLMVMMLFVLSACDQIRILPSPSADPNFMPLGDANCRACGERALAQCQERNPDSYPKWVGYNHEGVCTAVCTLAGPLLFNGGIRGPESTACPYQVNTTLRFQGEVCPSGTPITGDRDFWGHGPRFTAEITTAPGFGGNNAFGLVTATWTETEPDGSSITLPSTMVAQSNTLSYSPPFVAQDVFVTNVFPSRGAAVDLVMSSREQAIITPGDSDPLVEQMIVIGDTHADDISDDANCYDDARIRSMTFKPVRVTVGPR